MLTASVAALLAACLVGGDDCPAGTFCAAERAGAQDTCPAQGTCAPVPEGPPLVFSLPFPAGDFAYCGKKGPGRPTDSHAACDPSTRFALDLVSSAFAAPHLVLASADGIAWAAGSCPSFDLSHQDGSDLCNQGWGNLVRVEHEGGVYSQYAHLSAVLVHTGQAVKRGDVLGIEGNSGNAGAKHLHWSVHRGKVEAEAPSVPFSLSADGRTLHSMRLTCGDWTQEKAPRPETKLTSRTRLRSPPEQFTFRAGLVCPPGLEAIAPGACLARPERFSDARKYVVYFSGMQRPEGRGSARDLSTLAHEATRRGYAVLSLFGEAGQCDWAPESLCFPSAVNQLPAMGPVLTRLGPALSNTGRRLQSRFDGPPFVVGFSNGGFWVPLLMAHSKLEVRSYAVAHGGLPVGLSQLDAARARPTLLLGAAEDTWQLPRMKELSKALEASRWPSQLHVRDGGHALEREDAVRILDFFDGQLSAGTPDGGTPRAPGRAP